MTFVKSLMAATVAVAAFTGSVFGAGDAAHNKQVEWSFDGVFGEYDLQSAQRGWQVYREVCSTCHSLKYFAFRNLADLGYGEDMIKAFAAEYEVPVIDDAGDEVMIPAVPADRFPSPFPNEQAAAASNGGAIPPDLSLMVKARPDGANYLYSLLTGYSDHTPEDFSLPQGKYYNPYFAGGAISMAPPIGDDYVSYEDNTPATMDQIARDVTMFLAYVAEPKLEERKSMGRGVILFLIVLTGIFYMSMKKIWKPVKEGKQLWFHD